MTIQLINQLITPAILICFALGFAVIWFQFRHCKSAVVFAASYLMAATAFTCELFLEDYSQLSFLRIVADNLYLLSVVTAVIAFAIRYAKPVPVKWLLIIYGVESCAAFLIYIYMSDVIAKAYIVSAACSFMMVLALPIIKGSRHRLIDNCLFWAVGISALQLMLNAAVIVVIDKNLVSTTIPSEAGFVAILNFSVVVISLTIALCLFISYGYEIIANLKTKSDADALTGLLNRGAFEGIVEREIAIAKKNRFTAINDCC